MLVLRGTIKLEFMLVLPVLCLEIGRREGACVRKGTCTLELEIQRYAEYSMRLTKSFQTLSGVRGKLVYAPGGGGPCFLGVQCQIGAGANPCLAKRASADPQFSSSRGSF